jgi:hypothetical protein
MDPSFFVVLDSRWLLQDSQNQKRLAQGMCPVGKQAGFLSKDCALQVKFRATKGELSIDDQAVLKQIGDRYCIRSKDLCSYLTDIAPTSPWISFFVEGTDADARCIVSPWGEAFLKSVEASDPAVRLGAFDLPPATSTIVDADQLAATFFRLASSQDPELYALDASRFLDAPHIITALFSHVFAIQADDNIRFPIQVKKLSEQLRNFLHSEGASVRIQMVERSHLQLWSQVQGQRFGFLDGGVARIPAVAGMQPMGLRVGVYSVRPGIVEPDEREQWRMMPFVLGDLIDRARPTEERPDLRRFQEAARYTLEPLSGLQHLKKFEDTRVLLLHGPLVTQFLQYDEVDPNYLPFISPAFLNEFGINEATVSEAIDSLPRDSAGVSKWNQFMAIYGLVIKQVDESAVPIVGVVERPTGRAVILSVLERLKQDGLVTAAYVERVRKELERYDITDDFLFGCVLRAGEYITPVPIQKNPPHRARDHWQPVVRQFPKPSALLLKTEDMNFPFRVEMNRAAVEDAAFVARFLYHTARLLPRYAFPVGLDIVDKYAKVPDWISRGISAQLSAAVLRRALRTGDANVVSQVRLLLARSPRDFFFRPSARI